METKRLIFDNEQEWLSARAGQFTSSEINRLMAEPTKKAKEAGQLLSDGAITYVMEVISAELAEPKQSFINAEMQWGKDNEPSAALELCRLLNLDVNSDEVVYTSQGGIVFFTNGLSGGTPDLIFYGLKAISEIKCPSSSNHLYYKNYVTADNFQSELPKYYDQIQHNLYLTDMDKCFFFSYDPRFKVASNQSHLIEILRDEFRINQILEKINIANGFKSKLCQL